MALVVGDDNRGIYGVVECDRRGCYAHVAVRPGWDGATAYEMACEGFDLAEASGWELQGDTYCPAHRPRTGRRRPRLGDLYAWARTRRETVKGSRRLGEAEPLTVGQSTEP